MSAASITPDFGRLADRLADLRREIASIPSLEDRRIALDALRDALDRDADVEPKAGFIAGSFRCEGLIHRGSNFEVHRLRQRDAGTMHALKAPLAARASDPALRRMLVAEASAQARVVHPACLPFRALLRLADGRPALLTDLVEGPTLAEAFRRNQDDEADAIVLARRLCDGIAAVHSAGLVHGDIKPGNVLLPGGSGRDAMLFDFGLARAIGAPYASEEIERMGTNGFLSPERQVPGTLAHVADDLYALGRLLESLGSARDTGLRALIDDLTRPERAHRPSAVADVAARLADCGKAATT